MASGSVSGITIEFDSDVSGISRGIKDIEEESRSLQKQIKTLNNSLKFDSGNTELVAQKLDLMAQRAVSAASDVENLKNLQKQMDGAEVDKTSQAYRKLEQEIAIAESKAKSFKTQYENSVKEAPVEALERQYELLKEDIAASDKEVAQLEEKMAGMQAAGVKETDEQYVLLAQKIEAAKQKNAALKESLSELDQVKAAKESAEDIEDLGEAEEETTEEAENLNEANQSLQSGLDALQSVLISAGLISAVKQLGEAFASCVETNMEFEQTMSQVSALSGAEGEQLDALSEKAKELGANTKFTAAEAAEGFSYMALAGWDTEQMLSGIDGVINLAAAAEMDLGEASDIVTDYLTAFGWAAEDSGKFVDEMTYAMANSNTNVSQLGEAYKAVAATASSMGYSVEDTTAAIMVMSNAGLKGSEAGTALNAIMTRLATNTKDCADQLAEYGVQIYDDQGNMRTLSDILTDMSSIWYDLSDAEQASLAKVVAGTSHYSALQTVMAGAAQSAADGSSTFLDYADALENCDGSAEEMATTMQDNLAGSITKFQSATDGLSNSIGEQLTPAVQGIIDGGTDLVSKINEVINENSALVPIMTAAATALGGFTTAISAALIVSKLKAAIEAMGTTMTAALGPIGLASIAIGALVGGFVGIASACSDSESEILSLSNALDDQVASHTDAMQKLTDSADSTQGLVDELYSLSASYDGSAASAAEMQTVIDELNEAVPGLNASFDEQTGAINMSSDAMEAYIEKLMLYDELAEAIKNRDSLKDTYEQTAQALITAQNALKDFEDANPKSIGNGTWQKLYQDVEQASDAAGRAATAYNNAQLEVNGLKNEYDGCADSAEESAEATDDAADANGDLADSAEDATDELTEEEEAAQKANETMKDIAKELQNAAGSGDELMDLYEELEKEYENLDGAGDEWRSSIIEQSLEQLKLVASSKQLAEQLPLLASGYDGLASAIEATGYSVDDFVDSYNEAFSAMVGGFDEIVLDAENGIDEWIAAMDARTQIYETWNDNMAYLTECATDATTHPILSASEGYKQAIQTMMDGGVETYGTAAAQLAQAIRDGDTDTISALTSSIYAASSAAEQTAIIAFSEATGVTQSVLQELIDSGAATVANGQYQITDAAAAMAAGVPEGIATASDDAATSVDDLVQTAGDTFLDGTAQTAFEDGGKALDQYTASGVEENADKIKTAAQNAVVQAANTARIVANSQGQMVGRFFDMGLANGITYNQSLVYNAAYKVAYAAAQAARKAIDVGSPSKVAKEIGKFFSEGMAIGITNGTDMVTKAANAMSRAAAVSAATTTSSSVTNNNNTNYGGATYNISVSSGGSNSQAIADTVIATIKRTLVRA